MTPVSRPDLISEQQTKTAARDATSSVAQSSATTSAQSVGEVAKLQKAAKDFETVFLRQMLSALEKTTRVGDKGPTVPGQQTYGSMIVEAVADAVAEAGGIGLASLLAKALTEKSAISSPDGENSQQVASLGASRGLDKTLRSSNHPAGASKFDGISPQGLSTHAVPRTEIRTTSSQMMGQLADRRIR
jgi:peptidoglycan hydrolase FlgJ